jgi:hypothetical protein
MRFFNTEGPVWPADHNCLPPLESWVLAEVLGLIEQKKYFLLHAPRQTGKTSCLLALMERLNRDGRYGTVYTNLETAQTAREDVGLGMRATCGAIEAAARLYLDDGAGGLVVANPIYREVLPRALASRPQDSLPRINPT